MEINIIRTLAQLVEHLTVVFNSYQSVIGSIPISPNFYKNDDFNHDFYRLYRTIFTNINTIKIVNQIDNGFGSSFLIIYVPSKLYPCFL